MKQVEKFLVKLKELFLAENAENQKMLDTYIRFAEGKASDEELAKANDQLAENFKNLGKGILEMGIAWWSNQTRLQNLITGYSNKEFLKKPSKNSEGLLVLIKHSTHLELDLRLIASVCEMGGMYRPQKNLVINYFMRKSRNSYLRGVVSNSQSRKGILWIKRGLKFFYAADQDYGNKVSEYVPFFGHEAATVKLPGDLAASGLEIVFANVKRNKSGYAIYLHKFEEKSLIFLWISRISPKSPPICPRWVHLQAPDGYSQQSFQTVEAWGLFWGLGLSRGL